MLSLKNILKESMDQILTMVSNQYSMRKLFLYVLLVLAGNVYGQKSDYPIQSVSFTQVHLNDNFWLPRIKTNHNVTIPASFERCENTGRVKNFEMAAAKSGKFC